jgi:putative copper resistance protein D
MDWLLLIARALHFAACVSLVGLFTFECLVFSDIGRSALPSFADRVRRQLRRLAWTSFAIALLSGAAWFIVSTAQIICGQTPATVPTSSAIGIALFQTRFGQISQLRLLVAVLIGVLLSVRGYRRVPRLIAWLGLALSALLLVALDWVGHGGADSGADGAIHLIADLLHLFAAGSWVGMLLPLAILLATSRRANTTDALTIARAATHRFSVISMASVGILLVSGSVNTWYLCGSIPALIGTLYGHLLLVKIALFGIMLLVAAVNRFRVTPRLDQPGAAPHALATLRRNTLSESGLAIGVFAVIGGLGIVPPGLHAEPVWPLPVRVDFNEISPDSTMFLAAAGILFCLCGALAVGALLSGKRTLLTAALGGLALCAAIGPAPVYSAIEPAFPTSFYAPAISYDAAAVVRGTAVYSENCVVCHGIGGRGDGPAAVRLRVHPASLIEPHLFAHQIGDLFWWVSRGYGDAMPGFDTVLSSTDRWSVVHFIRARAAAVLSQNIGAGVTSSSMSQMPDFAFETSAGQSTLRETLRSKVVLLVLLDTNAAADRLQHIAAMRLQLASAGVQLIAVELGARGSTPSDKRADLSPVEISADVAATLQLFRLPDDGGETELMLDPGGVIRARWTAAAVSPLAPAAELIADAVRVRTMAAVPIGHAGHGG